MGTITRRVLFGFVLAPLLQVAAYAAPPQTRSYVSGTGSDGNACTATSPCQTLQAALAMTLAGGEIFVLGSANYGPATITKSITITGEGATTGILATSGSAITINAGATDIINLRGLDIDGGNSGTAGISFNSGASLNIQKSAVRNFTNAGISFTPTAPSSLIVSDTLITGNASSGILAQAVPGILGSAVLNRVTASRNGVGILANRGNVTIVDSVLDSNSYGVGATLSAVMIRNVSISNNMVGVSSEQTSIVRIGMSTVTSNGTGWQAISGGQVESFGNNISLGNYVDGTATSTVALQ